jgi:iron complex transport system ATP-binding protein
VQNIVEFSKVAAWRGETRVLDGLSLEIPLGSSTAILGPNGSGKSTLLKLLSCEIYPEHREGSSMRIFGRERWNVWELRTRLGIVSHDLQMQYAGSATGRDVLLSGYTSTPRVWPHHRFTDVQRARVEELFLALGISHLREKLYAAMSTGEQRRLLLGRALVHDPEALVLDEPTSGLDLQGAFRYLETVRALMKSGKTVLLVTHHIHEIPPEVERVILLKEGKVFADGTKAEVLTSRYLSELFGIGVEIVQTNGFYQAFPAPAA